MKRIEKNCVDCGQPCLHEGCRYYETETAYCDFCENKADFCIDNDDYCENCARQFLLNIFQEESIPAQAEMLGMNIKEY